MKNKILMDVKLLQAMKELNSEFNTRIRTLSKQQKNNNIKIKSLKQAQQELQKDYIGIYDKVVIDMDELDLDALWKKTLLIYYRDINEKSFTHSQSNNREYTGYEVTTSNAHKALRNSWFRYIETD